MIHAYDKIYLEKAKTSLGRMTDFIVYDLEQDIELFFEIFAKSNVAERFENGDSGVIAGKSGVELAYEVLEEAGKNTERITPRYTANRSEEYWTGYVLAHYQWEKGVSFEEILRYIPIQKIKAMYSPYHEMDIRQFVDKMDELYQEAKPDTNLKMQRIRAGYSQKELADISGVPVRTIQQYEQRRKNINKAQVEYIFMLAQALCCEPKDLLER
ncbi:MAG: helix-turn-helix transcriptional regulator [Roseburia sp.]|nr:helix-turn-helix transcriptional regulator [Roseburia sp.]